MVTDRTSPSVSFACLRFIGFTGLAFAATTVLSRWTTSRRTLLFLRWTLLFGLRLRLRSWLCGRTCDAFALRTLLLLRRRRTLSLWPLLHRTSNAFSLRPLLLRRRRARGLWSLLHWTCDAFSLGSRTRRTFSLGSFGSATIRLNTRLRLGGRCTRN